MYVCKTVYILLTMANFIKSYILGSKSRKNFKTELKT
jgi:hypothetical protein